MKSLITLLALFLSIACFAQDDTLPPPTTAPLPDTTIYSFAENMPQFPGKPGAFSEYLAKNIRYPKMERDSGIAGTVYVYFVIEKDGSVTNVRTMKGVPRGPGLAQEAERVIRESPPWIPGTMNGRAVRVSMITPIKFSLN